MSTIILSSQIFRKHQSEFLSQILKKNIALKFQRLSSLFVANKHHCAEIC
jgi:hypothetical protein